MKLVGKVALVTGASRGLGESAAQMLAARGMAIVVSARSAEDCERVSRDIVSAGGRAVAIPCDVSDADSVMRVVEEGAAKLGPIDTLINNAGMVDPIGRITELSPADFDKTLSVNLNGAFYAIRAVLPHMVEAGGGTIVNVSSGAAIRPLEGWSSYCASKAGLHMLTRSIALEVGSRGIRAFGFQPGTVRTKMQELIRASGVNQISQMTPEQHRPPEIPAQGIV